MNDAVEGEEEFMNAERALRERGSLELLENVVEGRERVYKCWKISLRGENRFTNAEIYC